MKTAEASQAVKDAQATLDKALTALAFARKRRTILCCCGKRHAIGKLALIVTHWYHEPHGCTGGDYYSEGEWRFVCPVNGVQNRLMFNDNNLEYEKRTLE